MEGAGRFAGASGSFTSTGSAQIVSMIGTTATISRAFINRGMISY